MFGYKIKHRLEQKLMKHNIPEETRNHLLIACLTFIMSVVPPFIIAVISKFTIIQESFDNIGYLWLSILFWLTTILTYPKNGVFYIIEFGLMCMVYVSIAIMVL